MDSNMAGATGWRLDWRSGAMLAIGLIALQGVILAMMDQPLICECGHVKFWHGQALSGENSQHLSDWYTPSHIIHGFLFYALGWFLFPRRSIWFRLAFAIVIEAGWEILENTDFIINRYREVTISLDYHGDSVINSVADTVWMVAGFYAAYRLPIWGTILLALAFEIVVGVVIRDNLTLNVIMLLHPFEFIRQWQSGA